MPIKGNVKYIIIPATETMFLSLSFVLVLLVPNSLGPLIPIHLCVQELQKDIVQHTEGITSVLTLCDMLLHDEDACSNNSENDSIQQTTHSLDQRWRNICSMSLERKIR